MAELEWTEGTKRFFKPECDYVLSLVKQYGKDTVNRAVEIYSCNTAHDLSFISPLNIRAFVMMLKCMIEDAKGISKDIPRQDK